MPTFLHTAYIRLIHLFHTVNGQDDPGPAGDSHVTKASRNAPRENHAANIFFNCY